MKEARAPGRRPASGLKRWLAPFLVGLGVGVGYWASTSGSPTPPAAPPAPSAPGGPGEPGPAPAGPHFREVAAEAGVRFRHTAGASGRRYLPETMGGGVCWLDANGDGAPDLLCVQGGALPGYAGPVQPTTLFLNDGRGRFRAVPLAHPGYGQGACAADYDGDGDVDVHITAFGRNTLLRNRGDATFEDVTEAAGVGDVRWGTSACWLDQDGDGDLDLYVVNYLDLASDLSNHKPCVQSGHAAYCTPDDYGAVPDVLYRNNGDGTFTDATRAALVHEDVDGKGLGVVAADLDGDRFPDLYVANDTRRNFLYRNRRDGTFEEVGLLAGCALSEDGKGQAGMGVEAQDADGDLDLDLLVTNYQDEYNAFYRNDTPQGGEAPLLFADASFASGFGTPARRRLGFGLNVLDLDQDGRLDAFVANGHVMDNIARYSETATHAQRATLLRGVAGGRFEEATDALGGPGLAPALVARGSAAADMDGDGDLDLAVSVANGDLVLLRAEGGPRGAWLILALRAKPPNTSAVGARVVVEAGGRRQVREVRAGSSYLSQDDLRLHFGLGAATRVDRIEVRWPSGRTDSLAGPIAASRAHVLVEGEPFPR